MARFWLAFLGAACVATGAAESYGDQQRFLDLDGTDWHKYVRAPSDKNILPARVLSAYAAGNVTSAGSLAHPAVVSAQGPTVLTRLAASDDIPTVVLDFGQNTVGLLTIDFDGSYNISTGFPGITLAFSETLQYLTDRSDFTRSDNAGGSAQLTTGTDQIAVKLQPYIWINQLGCEYGSQVCADGLHGFRYVKIRLASLDTDAPHTSPFGSVSIVSVSVQLSGYLGTPNSFAGHFECSDADITQWWYDAVYTNDLCTDVFLANNTEPRNAASPSLLGKQVLHDGAKRDRDPYVGDLAVSALTAYLSHNASNAALNVLEDLALHQRDDGWIPPASINLYTLPLFDYPLWWVVCSLDYVMYTGNVTYWTTYYSTLVKVLDVYYASHTNASTSLIEPPAGAGDYAFIPRTGPITYYNALYVYALGYASRVAQTLGIGEAESRWQARAGVVKTALFKRNFDADVGAFFDGGPCTGWDMCPTHAQDGNSLAILSGVVTSGLSTDTSTAESILSYMNRTMARPYGNAFYDNSVLDTSGEYADRVYAFISYFEIAARFETSFKASQGALEELRRLYGWMAAHDPTITFWEGVGKGGVPYEAGFTSMAHGWSTGIVPLLANYVLGVTPASPGFKKWNLRPGVNAVDLTWARGVVPTPEGGVFVQWERQQGGLALLIDSPESTQGILTILFVSNRSATVTVDGVAVVRSEDNGQADVDKQTTDGQHISLSISGGRHIIIVT